MIRIFSFLAGLACLCVISSAVSLRGPVQVSLHPSSNSSAPLVVSANHSNVSSTNSTRSYCITGGACLEYTGAIEEVADYFPWQYNVTEFTQTLKSEDLRPKWRKASSRNSLQHSASLGLGAHNLCMGGKLVPSFYLLGAQKAATSSFASEFNEGSNVVLPEMATWSGGERGLFSKELHFFDCRDRWQQGKKFWLDHWPQCPNTHMVAADFTPSYLSTWEAPMRLKKMYGHQSVKLTFLIILREPIARMQSSFYHGKSGMWVSDKYTTFQSYVDAAVWKFYHGQYRKFHDCRPTGKKEGPDFFGVSGCPFSLSLYQEQIKHWTQYFTPRQFMIAPMQAYVNPKAGKKGGLLRTISKWRGLDARIPPEQANPKNPPRLNVHSHPKVNQDLTTDSYDRIKQVFNMVTGANKLADLLAPLMKKGLVLYGYRGRPGDKNHIAKYIENNW